MKFYDNYNQLNYYYKEHVKIFNGTNTHNINTIYNNIEKYIKIIEQIDNIKYNYSIFYPNPKDICDNDELLNKHFKSLEKYVNIKNDIFTPIKSSTLSVEGLLSSITFKEEELIKTIKVPTSIYISKIYCNYGEILNPNAIYVYDVVKLMPKSKKEKDKQKKNRKKQGSGKYFASQITFDIFTDKLYKIKLFRNGGLQIPGAVNPDLSDVIRPINILIEYLVEQEYFTDKNVKIIYLISFMRNYIFKLLNNNYYIRLDKLEHILRNEKKNLKINHIYDLLEKNKTIMYDKYKISENTLDIIKNYIGQHHNDIHLAEIQNNSERYFGIIMKFNRPVPWKDNKKTSIKVLKSGKIGMDGSNSIIESIELYLWLIIIFKKYKDEIIFDITDDINYESDYSIGSGCSIYDSD